MMDDNGHFTRQEIMGQIRVWREAYGAVQDSQSELAELFGKRDAALAIYFTGCGSTYYLSLIAAAHLRDLAGFPAQGAPASELWTRPYAFFKDDAALVAVSRSGTTTETLRAVETFQHETSGTLVTISCVPLNPLAFKGQVNLKIPSGAELSIAQTGSFSAMLLAAMGLNAVLSHNAGLLEVLGELPTPGERVLNQVSPIAKEWGRRLDIDRIYFLGSGLRYGLACEASLKLKEMSLTHAEPFHVFEFRHGPKAMVTDSTLVVGLVSERGYDEEMQVLDEMSELGAQVITLGEQVERIGDGAAVSFSSGLPEAARAPLYLPLVQMLALERALAKGLNPDKPRNLDAVVVLESDDHLPLADRPHAVR